MVAEGQKRMRGKGIGKDGLLRAAREVAAEEGWGAVTVRKIADRVGYRTPVVYEYFQSKDDLLLELLRRGFADLAGAVRVAREEAPDPELALRGVARAYLRFAFASPDLYQVMYGLGGVSFAASETWEEGQRVGEEVQPVVEEALRKYGKEETGAAEEVLALWASVHGLVALTMAGRIEGGEEQADLLGEKAARDALLALRNR